MEWAFRLKPCSGRLHVVILVHVWLPHKDLLSTNCMIFRCYIIPLQSSTLLSCYESELRGRPPQTDRFETASVLHLLVARWRISFGWEDLLRFGELLVFHNICRSGSTKFFSEETLTGRKTRALQVLPVAPYKVLGNFSRGPYRKKLDRSRSRDYPVKFEDLGFSPLRYV